MFTTRPELLGTFGMVASTHWLASAAGMAILEKGGNAFDAAVATAFALQIVEPHLNGPGGEVPAIVHDAKSGKTKVLCGQGVAPAKATEAYYRSLGLDLVPGTGFLAATVPGSFDAWMLLLRDHGTLGPRAVLETAIGFAGQGYPLVPRIPQAIESVADLHRTYWPSSAAVYQPGGKIPEAGTLFRNPDLAATYTRVVKEAEAAGGDRVRQIEAARNAWYRGFVAEAIDRFCRSKLMDTSGEPHAGQLTADDMARWQASFEEPLSYQYGRYTVLKCGPWSQGPVFLQQLALLKSLGLEGSDPLSPEFVHTVVECAKLAFADREAYYGDPKFVKVPMETLLSDAYNDARRRRLGKDASMELVAGPVPGYNPRTDWAKPTASTRVYDQSGAGEPTMARTGTHGNDTCHLDVIDRHGNMVSATPSGGWLQSSPVVPGLGFCLGTRGQLFSLDETGPNGIKPGKRPRTTLTPSFAYRDGEPYLAFGTPGGDKQDQWSVLFFLHVAHHGMNLQESIECPAFHTEHFPSSFYPRDAKPGRVVVEGRFHPQTVEELKRRGHAAEAGGDWSEGRLSAVAKDGTLFKAGANPRGMQGYALGR
ncbi:MAG: gamma-glutamyltransferase family protein [Proteobacteria bacterium]|nr:gamma-glutamyltransferase family protein [Pseudomonadota bacterium]